jgi:hypothetical protein
MLAAGLSPFGTPDLIAARRRRQKRAEEQANESKQSGTGAGISVLTMLRSGSTACICTGMDLVPVARAPVSARRDLGLKRTIERIY